MNDCDFVPARVGFIQRELDRVTAALREAPSPEDYGRSYVAQQALSWALEPEGFMSPFDVIMGIPVSTADCSACPRPPAS